MGRDIEAPIQAAIVQWIRTVAPDLIVFHPANGGLRTKREASKLKWLGVLAGVADIVIIEEPGLLYFLEVKAPEGVMSSDQKDFRAKCRKLRVPYEVVHSINEAADALRRWGIKTRVARGSPT